MHDEHTARQLWCPMARAGENDEYAENRNYYASFVKDRPGTGAPWNSCISSQCMLWRWDNDEHGVCKQSGTGEPMRGYCGIGGKP